MVSPLNSSSMQRATSFHLEGPAYISFSGGRTSGYMLHRILEAHDGALPSNVHVLFANTGDEMPATLDFVQACSERWNVPITWVEYCLTLQDVPAYKTVSYNTASREGEPFDRYLQHVERITAAKGRAPYLPGPGNRFCTTELKSRPMKKWMLDHGYEYWTNGVGIRFDESRRWHKINRHPPERWEVDLPLVDEEITVDHVRAFWQRQPFDLGIRGDWEGNCDACHLKMPWKVAQVFQDHPQRAARRLAREQRAGKTFRPQGPSIKQLVQLSKRQIRRENDDLEIKCTGCTD